MIEDIYNACSLLFNIPMYMAKGIAGILRQEDIKIACTKLVQAQIPRGLDINSEKGRVYRNSLQKISHAYSVLSTYVDMRSIEKDSGGQVSNSKEEKEQVSEPLPAMPVKLSQTKIVQLKNENKELYYEGKIVPTRMRFGSFLYYSGVISYQMLEEALSWQKKKRPLIGQLAMDKGIIMPCNFAETLFYLKGGNMFGEIAKKHTSITENQIVELTNEQKKYNCQIGNYFIEKGLLEKRDIEHYIRLFSEHNYKYSE